MARFGPKLEREQLLLGRFVDLGTELFAIVTTCARANRLRGEAVEIADYFARRSRQKVTQLFASLHPCTDRPGYRLAQRVLAGDYGWVESGILP